MLTQQVQAFDFQRQSRLRTLIDFSKVNRISLGIETTIGLTEKEHGSVPAGVASSAIKAILGPNSRVKLTCLNGAILIRDQAASYPAWLDAKVPEFRMPRATLGLANAALWMRVELMLDTHQAGFAGSFPGDSPEDQVGPFNLEKMRVRALLCRLAGSSSGTTWVTGGIQEFVGTSWTNRLWTLVPFKTAPSVMTTAKH